ncbi:MAG: nusG [Alphaproteobacteria bacterium]|nr:nusG [Alphaproteobacteria bacterium]
MTHRWYVVHAYSGSEKSVADEIRKKAEKQSLVESFQEILVPTEDVIEIKRGQKANVERKVFPGYIMVRMDMNDTTWHLVKDIPRVTGFLGAKGKPAPISNAEAERLMKQLQEGAERPRTQILYEIGETVKVVDGPFNSFTGVVENVDQDKTRLTVSVSIFGRATPVELDFSQVEKNRE